MVPFVLGQLCDPWQSFLQERPYAAAYWPFSVMESCTSNANPPALTQLRDIELNQKKIKEFKKQVILLCYSVSSTDTIILIAKT